MRYVYVSNMPAPYREKVFQEVARALPGEFAVLYCKLAEPDRKWSFALGDYPMVFLEGRTFSYHNVYSHHVHLNPGIWKELDRQDPEVVVTNGYNPTHLIAFLWAMVKGRRHVSMTDGWLRSEEHLSFLHRAIRKFILKRTTSFLGASFRSLELYRHYGAAPQACFVSQLCSDNTRFDPAPLKDRPYDLLFSGQFIERKMPGFFVQVARLLKERKPDLKLLLLGDGPLREQVLEELRQAGIDFDYPGYLAQDELPARYASARLFLFPTLLECWGVVVNEACAAGTPVLTCGNTAVDGELVLDGETGRVLPLEPQAWADAAWELLTDREKWSRLSQAAQERVGHYTFSAAARGILDAMHHARAQGKGRA